MVQILLATALVSGVSAVAAALLLLAERFLARYGPCTIDVNAGDRRLEVEGGESLLATLMSRQIFIPSACGGKGTCAYCKLKVLDGGGPVAPTEAPLLSAEELADHVRISCQVKVRNDMRIEVPGHLLSVRQYRAVVERMADLTGDIKELWLRLAEPETIEFVPGQYVQLRAPAYGPNPEPVWRAYSIANPPSDAGHVELIIRLVPGGICTPWVFKVLAEGDEVVFTGPYGEFGLTESGEAMVWVAGGSGMAPFWSIARHMRERQIRRPCTYFFGALRRRDLFLLEEFRQLEKALPDFRFVPALSAPAEGDRWDGETGLITEVLERHLAGGAPEEAYLCGSGGMVRAAVKVLTAAGIDRERMFFDEFT